MSRTLCRKQDTPRDPFLGNDPQKRIFFWTANISESDRLIKPILLPAIFFPFAIRFGFRGSELVAILVMLGAPTTVSCYIMAKNMGNDEVLSSSMVVLATAASSVTLTMWIYFLKVLELI